MEDAALLMAMLEEKEEEYVQENVIIKILRPPDNIFSHR